MKKIFNSFFTKMNFIGLNQFIGGVAFLIMYIIYIIPSTTAAAIQVIYASVLQLCNFEMLTLHNLFQLLFFMILFILPPALAVLTVYSAYEIFFLKRYGKSTIISLLLQIPYISSALVGYYIGLGINLFLAIGFLVPESLSLRFSFHSLFYLPVNALWWMNDDAVTRTIIGVNIVSIIFLLHVFRYRKSQAHIHLS